MTPIKLAFSAGVIALATAMAPESAAAQAAYPSKSITLVVPAAAGGPTDTVARLIAESMGRTLGQTVIVENIGGAGGTIGMARVAKAAPDGYTIAVWHIAQATAPALYDNLKYDRRQRFRPSRPHHRRADDARVQDRRCRQRTSRSCSTGFAPRRAR